MINNKYQILWEKYFEGDEKHLSVLYYEIFDTLLNFGLKYNSNRQLVEDCLQNIFVDILNNKRKYKAIKNISFFLMKALRNQISNEQRKVKKLISVPEYNELEFNISYAIESSIIEIESEEIKNKFIQIVKNELSDRQKEAIYLKFNCGLDYSQIAELMNISVDSSRTLIYRSIKLLKETFATKNYFHLIFN